MDARSAVAPHPGLACCLVKTPSGPGHRVKTLLTNPTGNNPDRLVCFQSAGPTTRTAVQRSRRRRTRDAFMLFLWSPCRRAGRTDGTMEAYDFEYTPTTRSRCRSRTVVPKPALTVTARLGWKTRGTLQEMFRRT